MRRPLRPLFPLHSPTCFHATLCAFSRFSHLSFHELSIFSTLFSGFLSQPDNWRKYPIYVPTSFSRLFFFSHYRLCYHPFFRISLRFLLNNLVSLSLLLHLFLFLCALIDDNFLLVAPSTSFLVYFLYVFFLHENRDIFIIDEQYDNGLTLNVGAQYNKVSLLDHLLVHDTISLVVNVSGTAWSA